MIRPKTWKILAITFIILFILETLLVTTLFIIGTEVLNEEQACIDICTNNPDTTAYQYEQTTSRCSCSDDKGNIIYTERLS